MESYIVQAAEECLRNMDVSEEQLSELFSYNKDKNLTHLRNDDCDIETGTYDRTIRSAMIQSILYSMEQAEDEEKIQYIDNILNISGLCYIDTDFYDDMQIALHLLVKSKLNAVSINDITQFYQNINSIRAMPNGIDSAQDILTFVSSAYDFPNTQAFLEDETIKKAQNKIQQKIQNVLQEKAYLFSAFVEREHTNIPVVLLDDIYRGAKTVPFFYCMLTGWMPKIDTYQEMEKYIDKAINDISLAYVIALLMDDEYRRIGQQLKESEPNKPIKRTETPNTRCVFKMIRKIDDESVTEMAFFAVYMTIAKRMMSRFAADTLEHRLQNTSVYSKQLKEAEKQIRDLKKQCDNLNAQILHQKEESFRTIEERDNRIMAMQKTINALEHKIKSAEPKKTEIIQPSIERVIIRQEPLKQDVKQQGNRNGRYLFVTNNPMLAQRLKRYFPNARTSDNYPRNQNTLKKLEAIIIISSAVSHGEKNRWQNITNIPVIYTELQNMESLQNLLADNGFVESSCKNTG